MAFSSLELLMQKSIEFKSEKSSNSLYKNEDEEFKLSFAFQNLTEIDQKMLPSNPERIRILDLTENNFIGSSDLRFLFSFTNLKTLILDKNQIQSNIKLPFLPNLETLWLNHNKIENLAIFIENLLQSCPNLVYLSMINNKAAPSYFNGGSLAEYNDYRQYVVSKLVKLKMLDSKEITAEEKVQSKSIYGLTRAGKPEDSTISSTKSRRQSSLKNNDANRNKDKHLAHVEKKNLGGKGKQKETSTPKTKPADSSSSQKDTIEAITTETRHLQDFDPALLILPDLEKDNKHEVETETTNEQNYLPEVLDSVTNVENLELPPLDTHEEPDSIDVEFNSLPDVNE